MRQKGNEAILEHHSKKIQSFEKKKKKDSHRQKEKILVINVVSTQT